MINSKSPENEGIALPTNVPEKDKNEVGLDQRVQQLFETNQSHKVSSAMLGEASNPQELQELHLESLKRQQLAGNTAEEFSRSAR